MFLGNIGVVYRNQGKLDVALASSQAALELFKQIGNLLGQANTLGNIGNVYADQGKLEVALEQLRQARILYQGIGTRTLVHVVEKEIRRLVHP